MSTDVVFTMQPNGQLLGDIVGDHGHLRLLTSVLRGGRVASLALGSWSIRAISLLANPALQTVLHQDERWAQLLRV